MSQKPPQTEEEREQSIQTRYRAGEKHLSFIAYDHHPHIRGIWWMVGFCTFFFGIALGFLFFAQDVIGAFTFFLIAAIYFFVHMRGNQTVRVTLYEHGLLIEDDFFPWKDCTGYYLLLDEKMDMAHFVIGKRIIPVQLHGVAPRTLEKTLEELGVEHLEGRKESVLDMWIRILKL